MTQLADVLWNRERFYARFEQLSTIGACGTGVHRPFGSREELAARQQLRTWFADAGLVVNVDAAGNIWATRASADVAKTGKPAIVLGSHHDSVPAGGRFDGPLGVLMALEILESLADAQYANIHPLKIVSFTAEEPNPFGLSTLGSRVVAGRLSQDALLCAHDESDRPLADAIAAAGGDLARIDEARQSSADIAAYLELHIEQGLRLEQAGLSIGVVTGICAIYREQIVVFGTANHAGTTRMSDRHDALLGASEIALALEHVVRAVGRDDVVGTVGKFTVSPNAANIIPGRCDLILEVRGSDRGQMVHIIEALTDAIADIRERRHVIVERTVLLDQASAMMDRTLVDTLRESARDCAIQTMDLFSMAGHDATHMASITRSAMLFVPSVDGKSHCPEEYTRPDDIAKAAAVMLQSVVRLDRTLP